MKKTRQGSRGSLGPIKLPPCIQTSRFLRRVWASHHIGGIVRYQTRYLPMPPYHKRPPAPFEVLQTYRDRKELEKWMKERGLR